MAAPQSTIPTVQQARRNLRVICCEGCGRVVLRAALTVQEAASEAIRHLGLYGCSGDSILISEVTPCP